MMKKAAALFLVLALLLTAAGCTDQSGTKRTPDSKQNDQTTLPSAATAEQDSDGTTDAPRDVTLSFLGCGDNIIYYGNVREAKYLAQGSEREYDFSPTYSNVADMIAQADISFINQETLMCGEGYELSYYPRFNSPQAVGDTLVSLGFDVVSMANNHMLDQGESGLAASIAYWRGQDVLPVGGYTDRADSEQLRVLTRQGVRIAFLSYTCGTNGMVCRDDSGAYVPYLNDETLPTVQEQIRRADEEADLVIVSAHWGDEGSFYASDAQKTYAQAISDAGADVIVGHHPHVLQPVVWLTGEEKGNKTLCAYSLGNFVAEQDDDYELVGGMLSFDIHVSGDKVALENVCLIPTVYHFNPSFYDNSVWLMRDYTAQMAQNHGISYYGNRTDLEKLRAYVTNTIDPEFLPEDF